MKFIEINLQGAFLIEPEIKNDDRGFFARMWCQKEFQTHSLESNFVQINVAYNKKRGTTRGMHFQLHPHEEVKIIRCTSGAIYDVIVDLRSYSLTFKQWFGVNLTSKNYKMLYVPKGFAHGYQVLEDNSEIVYLVSEFFSPECDSGVRFNDPSFSIKWPLVNNIIISNRDVKFPDFKG